MSRSFREDTVTDRPENKVRERQLTEVGGNKKIKTTVVFTPGLLGAVISPGRVFLQKAVV